MTIFSSTGDLHYLPYGLTNGLPYGVPYGVPYGLSYGLPYGLNLIGTGIALGANLTASPIDTTVTNTIKVKNTNTYLLPFY